MTTCVKRILCAIAIIIAIATGVAVHAQDKIPWTNGGPLLPDSSNFVTASLLIASPGEAIYSTYGHSAIRMECPIHNLDYCFSFEDDTRLIDIVKFFSGNSNARIVSVETSLFLDGYRRQGRQIKQYQLNLSLHENQRLWQLLDESSYDETPVKFNFFQNNCTSVLWRILDGALINETISFNWSKEMKIVNGQYFRNITTNSKWFNFLGITFMGSDADACWESDKRVVPQIFVRELQRASLQSEDGSKRDVIVNEKTLLPLINQYKPSLLSPFVIFSVLLIIVIVITLLETKNKKVILIGHILDILLMIAHFILGCLLIYISMCSGLFTANWNWYIIIFNPLPFIIWLIWRKRKGFYKVYLFYTAVLVLFILATPLSEQLDLPHQLITASLAIRCSYHFFNLRRLKK